MGFRTTFTQIKNQLRVTDSTEPSLTWGEKCERIATDSLFRIIPHLISSWRLERIPEDDHFRAKQAGDQHIACDQRWRYGRTLSPKMKETYQYLRSRGLSRQDLRLAVFCRYLREDGSVKINWWMERALQAAGWVLLVLTLLGGTDLVTRFATSDFSLLQKVLFPSATLIVILVIEYPLLVLCLRAPRVGQKITNMIRSSVSSG